jgi:hypothetical protein
MQGLLKVMLAIADYGGVWFSFAGFGSKVCWEARGEALNRLHFAWKGRARRKALERLHFEKKCSLMEASNRKVGA